MKHKIVFAVIGTLAALSAVALTGAGQQAGSRVSSPAGDLWTQNGGS
ncbi:hypothetical protein ABH926_009194 [Catenulispora sp. GP43]